MRLLLNFAKTTDHHEILTRNWQWESEIANECMSQELTCEVLKQSLALVQCQ